MTDTLSDRPSGSVTSAESCVASSESYRLAVSEHRHWEHLEDIRASWSNLLTQIPEVSIFVTPECDPAYASDSVGYVLQSLVLQECVESGVRFYDFLFGDQDSKQRWGAPMLATTSIFSSLNPAVSRLFIWQASKARRKLQGLVVSRYFDLIWHR